MPLRAHRTDQSAPSAATRPDAPRPAALAGLGTGRPEGVLTLQRLAGNQAVGHHLTRQRESAEQGPAQRLATGVLQRKGADLLTDRVATAERSSQSLLGRWGARLTGPAPDEPAVVALRQAVAAYDAAPVRDPKQCLTLLHPIIELQGADNAATDAGKAYFRSVKVAYEQEMTILLDQLVRADEHQPADAPPYQAMTTSGALWNDPAHQVSAPALGMAGPPYFMELSEMNRGTMAAEIQAGGNPRWVQQVSQRLEAELRSAVLSHYTLASRADAMVAGGNEIKSKTALEAENPGAAHNTQGYDSVALANDGFTFWFIEPAGRTGVGRDTRFGKDESDSSARPARIELDIAQSGLLDGGWVMLTDFAQREYPILEADKAGTRSYLPTRKPADADPGKRVRAFAQGEIADDDQLIASIMKFADIADPTEKGSRVLAHQQSLFDADNRMVYTGGGKEFKYPELLHQNVLQGRDIVPGLAQRAVVEIMRLEKVNPDLAASLKRMSGAELMVFLLKDLVRPQAMIPNRTSLAGARIYRAPAAT